MPFNVSRVRKIRYLSAILVARYLNSVLLSTGTNQALSKIIFSVSGNRAILQIEIVRLYWTSEKWIRFSEASLSLEGTRKFLEVIYDLSRFFKNVSNRS